MNYKHSLSSFLFSGPQDFLLLTRNSYKIKTDSFNISKDTILQTGSSVVLKPIRAI